MSYDALLPATKRHRSEPEVDTVVLARCRTRGGCMWPARLCSQEEVAQRLDLGLDIDRNVRPQESCLVVFLAEGAHHYFSWVPKSHVADFTPNSTSRRKSGREWLDFKVAEAWATRLMELKAELQAEAAAKLAAKVRAKAAAKAAKAAKAAAEAQAVKAAAESQAAKAAAAAEAQAAAQPALPASPLLSLPLQPPPAAAPSPALSPSPPSPPTASLPAAAVPAAALESGARGSASGVVAGGAGDSPGGSGAAAAASASDGTQAAAAGADDALGAFFAAAGKTPSLEPPPASEEAAGTSGNGNGGGGGESPQMPGRSSDSRLASLLLAASGSDLGVDDEGNGGGGGDGGAGAADGQLPDIYAVRAGEAGEIAAGAISKASAVAARYTAAAGGDAMDTENDPPAPLPLQSGDEFATAGGDAAILAHGTAAEEGATVMDMTALATAAGAADDSAMEPSEETVPAVQPPLPAALAATEVDHVAHPPPPPPPPPPQVPQPRLAVAAPLAAAVAGVTAPSPPPSPPPPRPRRPRVAMHPFNERAFPFEIPLLECPWRCPSCRAFTSSCSCAGGLSFFLNSRRVEAAAAGGGRRAARYARFDCQSAGCPSCERIPGFHVYMAEWGIKGQIALALPAVRRAQAKRAALMAAANPGGAAAAVLPQMPLLAARRALPLFPPRLQPAAMEPGEPPPAPPEEAWRPAPLPPPPPPPLPLSAMPPAHGPADQPPDQVRECWAADARLLGAYADAARLRQEMQPAAGGGGSSGGGRPRLARYLLLGVAGAASDEAAGTGAAAAAAAAGGGMAVVAARRRTALLDDIAAVATEARQAPLRWVAANGAAGGSFEGAAAVVAAASLHLLRRVQTELEFVIAEDEETAAKNSSSDGGGSGSGDSSSSSDGAWLRGVVREWEALRSAIVRWLAAPRTLLLFDPACKTHRVAVTSFDQAGRIDLAAAAMDALACAATTRGRVILRRKVDPRSVAAVREKALLEMAHTAAYRKRLRARIAAAGDNVEVLSDTEGVAPPPPPPRLRPLAASNRPGAPLAVGGGSNLGSSISGGGGFGEGGGGGSSGGGIDGSDDAAAAAPPSPAKIAGPGFGDTVGSGASWGAVETAVAAVIEAVDVVMDGAAHNAFVAVRPPGHHAGTASRAQGATSNGFCLVNNVAVGALYARHHRGAARVAVVDFDIHHGNGTEEILSGVRRPEFLFISLHAFQGHTGLFPGTGPAGGPHGNAVNYSLGKRATAAATREATEAAVAALRRFRPELVLLSAGFDAHCADPTGLGQLAAADFAAITRLLAVAAEELCGGRIVSVLEGGYAAQFMAPLPGRKSSSSNNNGGGDGVNKEGLADCLLEHMRALVSVVPPREFASEAATDDSSGNSGVAAMAAAETAMAATQADEVHAAGPARESATAAAAATVDLMDVEREATAAAVW